MILLSFSLPIFIIEFNKHHYKWTTQFWSMYVSCDYNEISLMIKWSPHLIFTKVKNISEKF
jgi:hypothetical protein